MTDVDERLLSFCADYIVADKKGTAIIRNHVQTKGIPVKVIALVTRELGVNTIMCRTFCSLWIRWNRNLISDSASTEYVTRKSA